jgi:predicted MFS family arabinose efflux permease
VLTTANIVVFFLGASAFAMWYFVSLYLQQVLGFSPIEAGLAFLPMTAAIISASTLAGRLAQRIGAGRGLATGMVFIAVGMALFARVPADGTYAADVLVPGILTAFGIGICFVTGTVAAMSGVAMPQAGLASGLVNTSRQLGGSLGLAVLATVATQTEHGRGATALTSGFHHAFLVGAAFAATGAVIASRGLAGSRVAAGQTAFAEE